QTGWGSLLGVGGIARFVFAVAAAAPRGIHQRAEDLVLHRAPALVVALRDAGHGVDRIHTDDRPDLVAQFALLRAEELHALLQVARQHPLQLTAVRADHLREEIAAH